MKPTYEDITKYHSQATRLLVDIECYSLPMEIQITKVIDGGAVFSFAANGAWTNQWVKTDQVTVLHIFPPTELTKRLWDLEEAEKRKERKQDLKEIHEIVSKPVLLTQKSLDSVFEEIFHRKMPPLPKPKKPKKCKKKKNCPTELSK